MQTNTQTINELSLLLRWEYSSDFKEILNLLLIQILNRNSDPFQNFNCWRSRREQNPNKNLKSEFLFYFLRLQFGLLSEFNFGIKTKVELPFPNEMFILLLWKPRFDNVVKSIIAFQSKFSIKAKKGNLQIL